MFFVECLFGTNGMLGLLDGLPNDDLEKSAIYEVEYETSDCYRLVGKNFFWLKDRFRKIDVAN